MLRWFGILIAIALCSTSADAQVFKPKAKKPAAAEKKAKAKKSKKTAKKQSRSSHTKKRVSKKKSKRTRDEVASKDDDKDYVKIWDDDEVE
jgi:hypothetical protein